MNAEEHRERIKAALATARLCGVQWFGHVDDTEWLLAEVERLTAERDALREPLEWLVNLHHGVSRGTEAVETEDGIVQMPGQISDGEWHAAVDAARTALEEATDDE